MGDSGDEKGDDELRTISLDFGQVSVDATVVKAVRIRNDNCSEESYEIQRDPMTNPLDIAFHFDKYSWVLDSKSATICQVQYRPIFPAQKSIDYFTVVNCGMAVLKIITQGQCIGPNAVFSADRLVMTCAPGESVRKRVKIINDSDVSANFIFDVDEQQNSFKPEPKGGYIDPRSHMYIVITFTSALEGFEIFYLPCLVQHQAPIMLLLYGYCGQQHSRDKIPTLIYPPQENDGFRAYINDSNFFRPGRTQQVQPSAPDLISLSNNYLDFGRTVPGSYNSILRSPLTTCFTNHSKMDMVVKWHEDVDSIFSLIPNEARVRAGETYLFEVRFDPDGEDEFYTREITALAFWAKRDHPVPITSYAMIASVRLIGHTFSLGSASWIPQYEIPQAVIMPPCLPSTSVYTSFVIQKLGHLPLMFRFVPPEETHFSVKPMLGIIYTDYQVIVVEMFTEAHSELLYERWSIILNGNPEYEVFVDFRGYAEHPRLCFSNEVVTFLPAHPGCEQMRHVSLWNPTRHRLTYWFDDGPSALSVDPVRGQIDSNEIVVNNWIFCPRQVGDYEFYVACFTTKADCLKTSKIVTSKLRVVGKCELGYLSATPNELNFGEQVCNEGKSLKFQLTNPGPVEIPYMLTLKIPNWPYEEEGSSQVTIKPTFGILRPEEKEDIQIFLTPHESGLHEVSVQYYIRTSQDDELFPTKDSSEICRIKYFCILPTIKVEDLLHQDMVPNMSKYVLWRLLNINKLNAILSKLEHGEWSNLEMNIPPMMLRNEKSIITLLISNPSSAAATWSFKQIKLCSCSKISENRSLSFRCMKYNCLHRDLCVIYPKSGILKAHEKTTITMNLRYTILGETNVQWDLDIGHDRRLSLCMKIVGLSVHDKSAILLYGSHVDLKEVYIGDRDPASQICWIYNPTQNDVAYSLDTTAFKKINENHRCEIFSCLNPSGTVGALSQEPILINFQPRRWGVLTIEVPLTLGSKSTTIKIKGETTNKALIKVSRKAFPFSDISRQLKVPIYLNTDHVNLPPTPTHSRVTRLIMMHNRSDTQVIAYKWKRYVLPRIIELEVEPKAARIQPGTLQTCRLTVLTRGKPCRINVDITCEFIDQSKKRAYEKSIHMCNSLYEEMKHHFKITERGTTIPKAKMTMLEAPKLFYKTLTVRCHTYGPRDEELKTRTKERLKNTPPLEISMERRSGRLSATRETISLSKFILEGMIWEILQSKNLCAPPNSDIKYSQIAINPLHRKRIQKRSYTKPSGRTIERILENMIFTIIHKEFALDVIHLTQTSDARQVAYQKMWQRVPQ